MENKRPLWELFPELVEMVRQDHTQRGVAGGGHDFLHALMVAQYGKLIAKNKRIGVLVWVAGICHNTDHLFPLLEIKGRLDSYLEITDLSAEEKWLVIEAVIEHSKLNDPRDNPVTIALKDADRLANIGPNVFIRSGQFRPQLPTYDPFYVLTLDPESTFQGPMSCLDDIKHCLEWEQWLRLPKAKELAIPYFKQLRIFIKGFARQLKEVDLLPYPFKAPKER